MASDKVRNVYPISANEARVEKAKGVLIGVCIGRLNSMLPLMENTCQNDSDHGVRMNNADIRREAARIIYLTKFF